MKINPKKLIMKRQNCEELSAAEIVRRAVYGKIGKFTKSDIRELCPTVGKTSMENSIKQLVERSGLDGRSTCCARSDTK